MWDLTVSVPDHCLSFYFTESNTVLRLWFRLSLKRNMGLKYLFFSEIWA